MRLAILLAAAALVSTPAFSQVLQSGALSAGADRSLGVPAFSGIPMQPAFSGPGRGAGPQMTLVRTLLAEGKYAEADRILTDLVHRSNNSETYFLKGVSSLGTGQSASARTYFKSVLMSRKTRHAGAMTGLALSEIQLGNRPAAERILETLKSQDDRCDGRCSRSTSIEQAVSTVEKALG